jgi:hypothetical protein
VTAIALPDEEECYLIAILDDPSGIELAEFCWVDEEQDDGCFRCWDFQYALFRVEDIFQIDFCGRAIGKSTGIVMRAFAFPFNFPGQEMLITAPELNHLRPVTDKVENAIKSHRLTREMLPRQRGDGINHQPQFQAQFINNARIISRLPQRSGVGMKGSCTIDAMTLTHRGIIPLSEVHVGDLVVTDRGRWQPVMHIHRYQAETVEVAGWGHRGLVLSTNHRLLARRNMADVKHARELGQREWLPVDDEGLTWSFWASPTKFPKIDLPDPPCGITDGLLLLELAGRYVADGNLQGTTSALKRSAIAFTDDEPGIQEIEAIAKELGLRPYRRRHDHAYCTVINSVELAMWMLEHFGHMANGKRLPIWLLGAPKAGREAFLSGYLAGDGHWDEARGRWTAGTASGSLAQGLRLLGQSLGWAGMYSWSDPKVSHIMGVKLKKPPQRSFRVSLTHSDRALEEHGLLWGKIRSVRPAGVREVVDLVVAEDHSYIADGIVHLGSAWLPDGRDV